MKHCCKKMEYYANHCYNEEHELVIYHSEIREYNLMLHGHNYGMEQHMYYCPFCGTKLPKTLGEEWCKIVKDELGLDTVYAEEWETLPEEFKTDEWWKKRGL
ncbi:DUF6980 family protein [Candidatus Tisiphia endosymbiont of Temnostethus pusillus]|uniref:DUF6980 family protein n=1 Tax=Candidatus Tisiphia endosymbiont of Temnostethus pusillus TaxID=3139335 RepID=UPI0035C8D0FE